MRNRFFVLAVVLLKFSAISSHASCGSFGHSWHKNVWLLDSDHPEIEWSDLKCKHTPFGYPVTPNFGGAILEELLPVEKNNVSNQEAAIPDQGEGLRTEGRGFGCSSRAEVKTGSVFSGYQNGLTGVEPVKPRAENCELEALRELFVTTSARLLFDEDDRGEKINLDQSEVMLIELRHTDRWDGVWTQTFQAFLDDGQYFDALKLWTDRETWGDRQERQSAAKLLRTLIRRSETSVLLEFSVRMPVSVAQFVPKSVLSDLVARVNEEGFPNVAQKLSEKFEVATLQQIDPLKTKIIEQNLQLPARGDEPETKEAEEFEVSVQAAQTRSNQAQDLLRQFAEEFGQR